MKNTLSYGEVLFDFGAAHRREGDYIGINDKGLVTFDRKTRKDAYFFYQANWRDDIPVLHLCDKRLTIRSPKNIIFKAFSNQPECELFIDGKSYAKQQPESLRTCKWHILSLTVGQHLIHLTGDKENQDIVINIQEPF